MRMIKIFSFSCFQLFIKMDSDNLDEFLTRVLTASNAHELGGEVLEVLQQWKSELEPGVPTAIPQPAPLPPDLVEDSKVDKSP
jgi:hypothetical protein